MNRTTRPSRRVRTFRPGRPDGLEARRLCTVDVLTWQYGNTRTGANLAETSLTPTNVNATDFGKVGYFNTDGKVDAQPLLVSGVAIPGQGTHDVLIVATENDSVYAFDAADGTVLWHDGPSGTTYNLLPDGEIPVTGADLGAANQVGDQLGILSTPVIDRATGTIYVVAESRSVANGVVTFHDRIHALDLATGAPKVAPRAIDQSITYPGTGAGSDGTNVIFNPRQLKERDALTLSNGVVYTGWASNSDNPPYTGWAIGFDAADLSVRSIYNVAPNGAPDASPIGASGGSFWNSGAGFAVDADGFLYNVSANGPFDAGAGNYADSILKFSTANGGLTRVDSFTPFDTTTHAAKDLGLGSTGILLLPDLTDASGRVLHLALAGSKEGNIYLVDRDNLGGYDPNGNNSNIRQYFAQVLGAGSLSSATYYNETIVIGAVNQPLRQFTITNGLLSAAATSQTATNFAYPGATPTVSANGTSDGIVWAVENDATTAVLHAYDATDLGTELYNSNQDPDGRDAFGPDSKFIVPMVANGRVYVGTPTGIAVFGLLGTATDTGSGGGGTGTTAPAPTVAVPAFSSSNPMVGTFGYLLATGASSTYDASQLTYTWSVVSSPAGANPVGVTNLGVPDPRLALYVASTPGYYVFRVTIADPSGQTVTSDVGVPIAPATPTLYLEPMTIQPFYAGGLNQLHAVGIAAGVDPAALTYTWSTVAAPVGAPAPTFFNNGTNAGNLTAVGIATPGTYTFRVTITSPFGTSTTSDVTTLVARPVPFIQIPAVASGSPRAGGTVDLAVGVADPAFAAGSLVYSWSVVSRPAGIRAAAIAINPNNSASSGYVTARLPKAGRYVFQVTATNPFGQTATSTVAVTARPAARR